MEAVFSGCSASQNAFEEQINTFEEDAQEKCRAAFQDMPEVQLSGWFSQLLEHRIVPMLGRIGFDEPLGWALFKVAAPAWKLMGPITDQDIWFHPVLIKNIEEIRSGISSKARRNFESLSQLSRMTSGEFLSLAKAQMDPEHLLFLLEDISTPWIILPRVYDQLKEHQSQYLLGYLDYLDSETDSEFGKILTRITIEFIGNYTLKYMSEIHPKDRVIYALFYGYAAMFWKNLRSPPNGLEDIGIFENFLRWARMLQNRFASSSGEMAMTIEAMKEFKEKAFPVFNAFGLARDRHDDMARFLVTLRHGYSGIDASSKYFGLGGSLLKNATDGGLPYSTVPMALSQLFREIKYRYLRETPRTQQSIRRFLKELRASYDLKGSHSVGVERRLAEEMEFVAPRILDMVHDLTEWIHLNRVAVLPNSPLTGL